MTAYRDNAAAELGGATRRSLLRAALPVCAVAVAAIAGGVALGWVARGRYLPVQLVEVRREVAPPCKDEVYDLDAYRRVTCENGAQLAFMGSVVLCMCPRPAADGGAP